MPEWDPSDLERRATMEIDVVSRVIEDPLSAERRLWENADY